MKKNIFLCAVLLMVNAFMACSQKFPEFEKDQILKNGDILLKTGTYKNKNDKKYPKKITADYITMAVKENRNKPDGRIITIPVLRLHSLSKTPKEPVFLLNGGPGGSNLFNFALFLIEEHDVVMVGYRGADGSTILTSKVFAESLVTDSNTFSAYHCKNAALVLKGEMDRWSKEGIDLNCYNIIEVIDDIENARIKLGYNKIDLFGYSYGTRLAYIYGLRYPESIKYSFSALVNPPGHFCYDPDIQDNILKQYNELWKKEVSNLERSPDIVLTIKNVLSTLPVKWKKIYIDPAKVRFMSFIQLYTTYGATQIFDAFVAAENGDYSGLACMVMMFDMSPEMKTVWGDLIMKGGTADYIPGKDYISDTDSKENLIGAIHSKLFALVDFSGFHFKLIPEQYRKYDTSYVNTLLINGNLDISTPLPNAQELIKYLPNGKLVVVSDYSHMDIYRKQPEVFNSFIIEYFNSGKVNDQNFDYIPADLSKPEKSLQKMGKTMYMLKRVGLLKPISRIMM